MTTLVDAGPLVALVDADEEDHPRCRAALRDVSMPLVTSWAAFTEAMYLLGRGGWHAQDALWRLVARGDLELVELGPEGVERAATLMARYKDRPMDLADATLVVIAELLSLQRVFTLDGDFHIYRMKSGRRLEPFPG